MFVRPPTVRSGALFKRYDTRNCFVVDRDDGVHGKTGVESFVEQVTDLVRTHQVWAGPVVGLLAFGESLVLIGVLLPGTTVLVVVGGLVGAGVLGPIPVIAGAIIGAVLGDVVSYLLGTWLGRRIVYRWPLNRYREAVARARLLFRRYGFAAVFVGRFFGPIRSAVPLVAGITGMDWRRFQLANLLSAVVWAPVVLSPGWLVARGAAGAIAAGEADWVGYAAVALAIAAVVGVKLLQARGKRRRIRPIQGDLPAE